MKTTKAISLFLTALTLSALLFIVFNFEKPVETSILPKNKKIENITPKLFFEPNQGQADNDIKFISNGKKHKLLLTDDGAILVFNTSVKNKKRDGAYVCLKLEGAKTTKQITGRNKMTGKTNYLLGNNPDKWITNIPNYTEVFYEGIYPGIDLVFYGNDGILEYDFIVSPNGNPKDILVGFESDKKQKMDKQGNLIFRNKNTEVVIKAPVAYQIINKEQEIVEAKFVKQKNGCIGFELGNYDKDLPLVIDPKIIFSTYFSNNTQADANDIALDSIGNIYITGINNGINFPVTDENLRIDYNDGGPENVFVTKMDSDGTEILYSTYFGGEWEDIPLGIAVDHEGNIIVCGQTFSRDFPLVNAIQTTFRGDEYSYQTHGDGFIAKINPGGDEFIYSTYLGGDYDDCASDIVVDDMGYVFVTGWHDDDNFPYKNPIGILDCGNYTEGVYVAKIAPSGTLEFATCIGDGEAYGIAIDKNNDVYITGEASSTFYTTPGAYRTEGSGAFVSKLNNAGTSIEYSTFIYRKQYDDESCFAGNGDAIAVDTLGNAYVAGNAGCDRLSLINEFQSTGASFVVKLSADGSSLLFASYFGGTNINEYPGGIDIDKDGDIYVTGITFSPDFPVVNGFQTTLNGNSDAYVAMIDGETFELVFATYLGGTGWEGGVDSKVGIAVDEKGYVHLAGYATDGFPIENALQETTTSGDAFVVKLIVKEKGKLKVVPDQIIFPYTEQGQISKEAVELSNSGTGLLEIKNITVEPTDIYSLEEVPTLPYKLEPEQNVGIKVVYSPSALKSKLDDGAGEAKLKILSDGEEEETEVSIISAIIINDTTDVSDIPDDNICDINLSEDGYQVTLRAAIEFINSMENAEITKVTFDIPIEKVPVIHPLSALAPIEYPVSFDASTQSKGYVIIDGSQAGADVEGLVIKAGSSKIKDINIINFGSNGIQLCEKDSNIIDNCEVFGNGISASDPKRSNGLVINNSSKNKITNSVISNNKGHGIVITGSSLVEKNIIDNNNIGTSILGLFPFPNGRDGLAIETCVSQTMVNDNLISGNKGYGISIINSTKFYEVGDTTIKNTITNNVIGINIMGTDTLPNKRGGILLAGYGVQENIISANIIAGNVNDGIDIINNSTNNYVVGNMIGLALEDNTAIGNSGHGILLDRVQDNTIDTNIIVNNSGYGVYIYNNDPRVNVIKYNYIGRVSKNYNHDTPHKNWWGGIYIEKGAPTITDNLVYDHDTSGIHIVNASAIVQFNKIRFNKTGIEILTDNENFNTINKNYITENGTGIRVAGVEIPNESKSSSLKSTKGLRFLGTKYATDDGSYNTIINGNFIYKNVDENTGIHIENAPVFICGNLLDFNEGNAISVSGDEKVTVKLNNFYSNVEYGLNNNNPITTIDATNNYWGASTGPGGYGPGTGDEVSVGVDFSDWQTDWVAVYASAERDTFPAVIGITDSVLMVFENWDRATDTLDVYITDEMGWIAANSPRQIQTPLYSDEIATLFFTIPKETDNNTFNKVNLRAISQANPNDSAIFNFFIHAQKPALEYLLLFPDTIEVESGSTKQFSVYGYDQTNHLMDFSENWSCTGGTIDDYGLFTAGENIGIYHVVVEDPTSELSETAVVSVVSTTQIEIEVAKNKNSKQLLYCYPNPFNSSTIIKYELETPGYVTLNIYNSIGQEVGKIVDGFLPTGTYEINWQPNGLKNGTYFSKIEISSAKNKTPVYTEVQKMMYVKSE